MTMTPDRLWTRDSHTYYVEGRIGQAWAKLTDLIQDRDKATAIMWERLSDPSVREVRLVELSTRVSATIVDSGESIIEAKPETKMRPTERRVVCGKCKSSVPVMEDGQNAWACCATCNRVLPV